MNTPIKSLIDKANQCQKDARKIRKRLKELLENPSFVGELDKINSNIPLKMRRPKCGAPNAVQNLRCIELLKILLKF